MKSIKKIEKIILEKDTLNSKSLFIESPLQISTSEEIFTEIKQGGFIIIDFGVEMKASLRILTFKANAHANVRYGESVTETIYNLGEKNSTNDHALRDFKVFLPNYSDIVLFNSGFRFVKIDAIDGDLKIKKIVAVNEINNKKSLYFYDGKDDTIKDIFNVAKRTIDLCSSGEYIWDGIKRDRLVWVGDMHPEMLALTTLYGKSEKLEKSLNYIKDKTVLPLWMNGMSSYSLWWIIILSDYVEKTNRLSFLKKQKSYLLNLVKYISTKVYENGEMNFENYFTDWPTNTMQLAPQGQRAICIIAMEKAKKLFSLLQTDNSICEKIENNLKKIEIKCYGKKQLIALKYFAIHKISEQEKKQLVDGGPKGLSTFMSYYILTAIASFDKQKAIEIMKEYFGKMIELGATTFWEDFNMEWAENSFGINELPVKNKKDIHGDFGEYCYKGFRHSLCHGWSSGVIAFIKENC